MAPGENSRLCPSFYGITMLHQGSSLMESWNFRWEGTSKPLQFHPMPWTGTFRAIPAGFSHISICASPPGGNCPSPSGRDFFPMDFPCCFSLKQSLHPKPFPAGFSHPESWDCHHGGMRRLLLVGISEFPSRHIPLPHPIRADPGSPGVQGWFFWEKGADGGPWGHCLVPGRCP